MAGWIKKEKTYGQGQQCDDCGGGRVERWGLKAEEDIRRINVMGRNAIKMMIQKTKESSRKEGLDESSEGFSCKIF